MSLISLIRQKSFTLFISTYSLAVISYCYMLTLVYLEFIFVLLDHFLCLIDNYSHLKRSISFVMDFIGLCPP